jgi:hypothetical protein
MTAEATVARLLDFSQPIDVPLLDSVVTAFFGGAGAQRDEAQKVLTQFQQHPDSWSRVDSILEYSQNPNTKYLALQILESVIKVSTRTHARWDFPVLLFSASLRTPKLPPLLSSSPPS